MPKYINTLANDIYHILDSSVDHKPSPEKAGLAASRIAGEIASATLLRDKPREKGKLWASDLGKDCFREMWFKFNDPGGVEPLLGHAKFKFLYGHLIEESLLYLAEEAGHTVELCQERVEYEHESGWKISGRIDAVIDGTLTDVKSTSTFGFAKYKKEGLTIANDTFGYRYQLGFYNNYNKFEDRITSPQYNGFTWVEKQNGHIYHMPVASPTIAEMDGRIATIIEKVEDPLIPSIYVKFASVPDGKSGNMKLCTKCSYCDFKHKCRPNLRTFLYSTGPRHLVTVAKVPNVQEVTK